MKFITLDFCIHFLINLAVFEVSFHRAVFGFNKVVKLVLDFLDNSMVGIVSFMFDALMSVENSERECVRSKC